MASKARLVAVELDEMSIARPHPLIEEERAAAIRDLVGDDNLFRPAGRERGRFRLKLSIESGKLVFDVADGFGDPVARHLLSLTPLARLIKDYFLVCESLHDAIGSAPASRIEAIDMGRRGIHNDGSNILMERLKGKVTVDLDTARRLFTLICVLHWKG